MKIKHSLMKVCLLSIATIAASLVGASAALAGGGAGSLPSGGEQSSSTCSKDWDWDVCGGGFIRMDVDNPVALINDANHSGYPSVRSDIRNTVVPACKKAGATEFYLLALHVMSGGRPTGTFGNTREVRHLQTVNQPGGKGEEYNTRYLAGNGVLQFKEAYDVHEAAVSYAKKQVKDNPANYQKYQSLLETPWENVTYFCWNPEWETQEAETSFGAFSLVVSDKLNSGNRNSTYPNVDSKKTWEITSSEDKVRVTFAHKFFYYGGNKLSSNTTEKASTNWGVIVTRDGKGYYEPDHVGWIDGSSFGGEFSLPGYNKSATYSGSNGSGCPGNICPEDIGVNTYDIDISDLGLGESTVVCSEISYDPKAFLWRSENGGPFKIIKRTNAKKSSTGCVKITRGSGENVKFWSNSSVDVISDSKSETSDNDGTANVTVTRSAESKESVTVRFWHNLHYTGNIPDNLKQDICTNFNFTYKNSLNGSNKVNPDTIKDNDPNATGNQYCVSKNSPIPEDSPKSVLGNESEAVGKSYEIAISDLQPGENKICQTINYDPKTFQIFQDKKTNEVSVGKGSGKGSSTACVTIIKDKGVDPPKIDLTIKKDIYYTGEKDTLKWEQAEPSSGPTKVLREMRLFYYQVPVGVTTSPDPTRANDKFYGVSPYTWFEEIGQGFKFTPVESVSDNTDYHLKETTPLNHSAEIVPSEPTTKLRDLSGTNIDIIVPDNVGDKICIAVASRYQEYEVTPHPGHPHYGLGANNQQVLLFRDTTYTYDKKGEEYWDIEGATCRTIVKKPSTNIWNGSLSTRAGVITTISNRYSKFNDTGYIAQLSENAGDERRKFGSWVEYLAVVGGEVKGSEGDAAKAIFGFGSGASLAYRGSNLNASLLTNSPLTNSPLTIANNRSPIGNSGLSNTSTFTTRLTNFIRENANSSLGEVIGNRSISDTRIIYTDSNVQITDNIEIANPTNGIRTLPQVVIYAGGGVTIAPNVTRIDAWLITPSNVIDTCQGFNSSTEAYIAGYNSADIACAKQLTINGPVIASGAKLARSAGSDPISYNRLGMINTDADPRSISGEMFNLSANTYLWAYSQASSLSSSYTEAYSRELPPRY